MEANMYSKLSQYEKVHPRQWFKQIENYCCDFIHFY